MRLVCEVLERDGIEHFVSKEQLTVYFPCKADLKYRKLRPNLIRVCMIPQDEGFLFEANLPVTLHTSNKKTRRQMLRLVAKENSSISYGGLVYKSESQKLIYRAFYFLQRNMHELDADKALTYIRHAADALLDGYQNITNELDSISDNQCCGEMLSQIDDETEMDLECLLDMQDERNMLFLLDDRSDDRCDDTQN